MPWSVYWNVKKHELQKVTSSFMVNFEPWILRLHPAKLCTMESWSSSINQPLPSLSWHLTCCDDPMEVTTETATLSDTVLDLGECFEARQYDSGEPPGLPWSPPAAPGAALEASELLVQGPATGCRVPKEVSQGSTWVSGATEGLNNRQPSWGSMTTSTSIRACWPSISGGPTNHQRLSGPWVFFFTCQCHLWPSSTITDDYGWIRVHHHQGFITSSYKGFWTNSHNQQI